MPLDGVFRAGVHHSAVWHEKAFEIKENYRVRQVLGIVILAAAAAAEAGKLFDEDSCWAAHGRA